MQPLRLKKFIVLTLAATMLTACGGGFNSSVPSGTLAGIGREVQRKNKYAAQRIAAAPYIFKINRFVDKRLPEALSTYSDSAVLHAYNPDRLPGNAAGYIRSIMVTALEPTEARAVTDQRLVEVTLRDVEARIVAGNFISGQMGRYMATIQANVLVRDLQGNVLLNRPYEITREGVRQSFDGRQLSPDEDWHNMRKVIELAAWDFTYDVADDVLHIAAQPQQAAAAMPQPVPAASPAKPAAPALIDPTLPPVDPTVPAVDPTAASDAPAVPATGSSAAVSPTAAPTTDTFQMKKAQ